MKEFRNFLCNTIMKTLVIFEILVLERVSRFLLLYFTDRIMHKHENLKKNMSAQVLPTNNLAQKRGSVGKNIGQMATKIARISNRETKNAPQQMPLCVHVRTTYT